MVASPGGTWGVGANRVVTPRWGHLRHLYGGHRNRVERCLPRVASPGGARGRSSDLGRPRPMAWGHACAATQGQLRVVAWILLGDTNLGQAWVVAWGLLARWWRYGLWPKGGLNPRHRSALTWWHTGILAQRPRVGPPSDGACATPKASWMS